MHASVSPRASRASRTAEATTKLLHFFKTGGAWAHRLVVISGTVLFLLGLSTIGAALHVMRAGYSPTPVSDPWSIYWELSQGAHWFSPAWLWQQHNEHRIPLDKLALYADFRLLKGHGVLLLVLIVLTLAAQWIIWTVFLRKALRLPAPAWLALSGFFTFCTFCPTAYENLTISFQWTFVAASFFATVSFVMLSWLASTGEPWLAIAVASLFAFLSEASLANGLIAWPILFAASFALAFRWRHRAALLISGMVAIAVYLFGYQQPVQHANPFASMQDPWVLWQYVLTFIDHCLSYYVSFPALAAIVLSAAAFIALAFLLRRPAARIVALPLFMTMCFVLATAVMTAMGRINFGMESAMASRYQTLVMLYWACAFTSLALAAWQWNSRRDVLTLNALAIALILLPAPSLAPQAEGLEWLASLRSLAGQGLDQGVIDASVQRNLVVGMPVLIAATRYFHSFGRNVGPHPPPLPRSALLAKNRAGHACGGWFDTLSPLARFSPGKPEFDASGWAIDSQTKGPVPEVAVIDEHGRLLSASALHFGRGDVLARRAGAHGLLGWQMLVPLPSEAKELRALAIIDGHACMLAGRHPLSK